VKLLVTVDLDRKHLAEVAAAFLQVEFSRALTDDGVVEGVPGAEVAF
jgi:hypothetical protein